VGAGEIVALVTVLLAVGGSLGAVVKWAGAKFESQGKKLSVLEAAHANLFRDHSLLLVRLERFRLAFQMVASELARKSPGNPALMHAKALLDDAFSIEPDLPDDLRELLRKLDERSAAQSK
jgi:hypothetical protein